MKLIKNVQLEGESIINSMINDIYNFLTYRNPQGTNQVLIGYKALFKGYIVRNWVGAELSNRFEDYNKIIIVKYIQYYSRCWTQRCNIT